jgi:hypothetical protein
MSRSRQSTSALRTPLLLLFGLVFLTAKGALIQLSLPNGVRLLAYLLGLFIILEMRGALWPPNKNRRQDLLALLAALLLAAVPWFVLLDTRALLPLVSLLPLYAAYTTVLWIFIAANAELAVCTRLSRGRPWMHRLREWTFPLSDLLFFKAHRQDLGPGSGLLRFVPALSYMGIIAFGLTAQIILLTGKLPVLVYNPGRVVFGNQELWYSETISIYAGLWRYDTETGQAKPYTRAQDLRRFRLQDGALYFYDRFENTLFKMDSKTQRVDWSFPIPHESGEFDVLCRNGLTFAVGTSGRLVVLDPAGRPRAEKILPYKPSCPQMLEGGRIALIAASEMSVRILGSDLAQEAAFPLPRISAVTATAYDDRLQTLYVATLRGEVFRRDMKTNRWLPPHRLAPGIQSMAVDSLNGLLFAYHRARGYVDVRDLKSGQHLQCVLVNVFGNSIDIDPKNQVAVVSARGPGSVSAPQPGGLYRFDYRALTPEGQSRENP